MANIEEIHIEVNSFLFEFSQMAANVLSLITDESSTVDDLPFIQEKALEALNFLAHEKAEE